MSYKFLESKKTKIFDGKEYRYYKYVAMNSEANNIVKKLREKGVNARITPHPGYGTGGWDIYIRKRKKYVQPITAYRKKR